MRCGRKEALVHRWGRAAGFSPRGAPLCSCVVHVPRPPRAWRSRVPPMHAARLAAHCIVEHRYGTETHKHISSDHAQTPMDLAQECAPLLKSQRLHFVHYWLRANYSDTPHIQPGHQDYRYRPVLKYGNVFQIRTSVVLSKMDFAQQELPSDSLF